MTALLVVAAFIGGALTRREVFACSEFAGHLRAASRAAFAPAVLCSLYVVGLAVGDLVRVAL